MKATTLYNAVLYKNQTSQKVDDTLTVEEILNMSINEKAYSMTMRTPGDEEALVRGLLLTENIYNKIGDHIPFHINEINEKGIITHININIPQEDILEGIQQQRNLVSVSSCGMCGKNEMELQMSAINHTSEDLIIHAEKIHTLFEKMQKTQSQFIQSGGSHAAAIFDKNYQILSIGEDIGRHNAVDKAIGKLLLSNTLSQAHCLTVSGRVSYEIVSKCFRANIPFLASVSAPSSLAVDYANISNITLLAFCRGERFTAYTFPERVIL